jgi:hypothetical protein
VLVSERNTSMRSGFHEHKTNDFDSSTSEDYLQVFILIFTRRRIHRKIILGMTGCGISLSADNAIVEWRLADRVLLVATVP